MGEPFTAKGDSNYSKRRNTLTSVDDLSAHVKPRRNTIDIFGGLTSKDDNCIPYRSHQRHSIWPSSPGALKAKLMREARPSAKGPFSGSMSLHSFDTNGSTSAGSSGHGSGTSGGLASQKHAKPPKMEVKPRRQTITDFGDLMTRRSKDDLSLLVRKQHRHSMGAPPPPGALGQMLMRASTPSKGRFSSSVSLHSFESRGAMSHNDNMEDRCPRSPMRSRSKKATQHRQERAQEIEGRNESRTPPFLPESWPPQGELTNESSHSTNRDKSNLSQHSHSSISRKDSGTSNDSSLNLAPWKPPIPVTPRSSISRGSISNHSSIRTIHSVYSDASTLQANREKKPDGGRLARIEKVDEEKRSRSSSRSRRRRERSTSRANKSQQAGQTTDEGTEAIAAPHASARSTERTEVHQSPSTSNRSSRTRRLVERESTAKSSDSRSWHARSAHSRSGHSRSSHSRSERSRSRRSVDSDLVSTPRQSEPASGGSQCPRSLSQPRSRSGRSWSRRNKDTESLPIAPRQAEPASEDSQRPRSLSQPRRASRNRRSSRQNQFSTPQTHPKGVSKKLTKEELIGFLKNAASLDDNEGDQGDDVGTTKLHSHDLDVHVETS